MAKVRPYHSTRRTKPAVFYTDAVCPAGKQIKVDDKVSGMGMGRTLCDWCANH
jgi:hypothetical protein